MTKALSSAVDDLRECADLIIGAMDASDDGGVHALLGSALVALNDAEEVIVVHRLGGDIFPHRNRQARVHAERLVRWLHGLGERAVGEFIAELARRYDLAGPVLELLEAYGRIHPETLRALGADKFPPVPVHLVQQ